MSNLSNSHYKSFSLLASIRNQERLLLLSLGAGSYQRGSQGRRLLQQRFKGGIKPPYSSLLAAWVGALGKMSKESFSIMDLQRRVSTSWETPCQHQALVRGAEQLCLFCLLLHGVASASLLLALPAALHQTLCKQREQAAGKASNNLLIVNSITTFTCSVNLFMVWSMFLPHTRKQVSRLAS